MSGQTGARRAGSDAALYEISEETLNALFAKEPPRCKAEGPGEAERYECTRKADHQGIHVAHTGDPLWICAWRDESVELRKNEEIFW